MADRAKNTQLNINKLFNNAPLLMATTKTMNLVITDLQFIIP